MPAISRCVSELRIFPRSFSGLPKKDLLQSHKDTKPHQGYERATLHDRVLLRVVAWRDFLSRASLRL